MPLECMPVRPDGDDVVAELRHQPLRFGRTGRQLCLERCRSVFLQAYLRLWGDVMFWGLERRRQFDQAYEFGTIAVPIPGAETPGEVLCARLRRAAFELRPPLRRR